MTDSRPETVIERFSVLLAKGDLDAMMELYEPDAAFAPSRAAVTGHADIRAALEAFLAVEPNMEGTIEKVRSRRHRPGHESPAARDGSDGSPVRMAATSSDVLRRRADGLRGGS